MTKRLRLLVMTVCAAMLFAGCYEYYPDTYTTDSGTTFNVAGNDENESSDSALFLSEGDTYDIHIIDTSDTHGKFYPWDYFTNEKNTSGSFCQLKSAIDEYADEDTIIVDGGDIIQDNCMEMFAEDDFAPMAVAMNAIGYDLWSTGNHEYNYGMDALRRFVSLMDAPLVVGNVYDENGGRVGKPYEVITRNGIKIAFIGEVTPNITKWDAANMAECTVTNPADEVNAVIDELGDSVDVKIGLFHMGLGNEYMVKDSGCYDLAEDCPQLDMILSAHDHSVINDYSIGADNDIPVTQNKSGVKTFQDIHINMKVSDGKWVIDDIKSQAVDVSKFDSDKEMMELLKPYHEKARKLCDEVIGTIEEGEETLGTKTGKMADIFLEDSSVMDLINEVMMYYADADISTAAPTRVDSVLRSGKITRSDIANIYKYENTLYKVEITGAQLKTFMENAASYYKTFKKGDKYVEADPDVEYYLCDMFAGVNYEINISKPVGSRIENLTYPNGIPVKDDDVMTMAVNNYRVNSCLMVPGLLYDEDDMPKILETDLGSIRDMIVEYIQDVNGGTYTPYCDHNWKLTGTE